MNLTERCREGKPFRFSPRLWVRCLPGSGERLFEVGEEIAPVLDADGDAHQAVGHAGFGELLLGHARMRGALRMADQGLDSAERHGVAGDADVPQEIERGFLAAFEIERKEAPRVGALLLVNALLLGVVKKGWID